MNTMNYYYATPSMIILKLLRYGVQKNLSKLQDQVCQNLDR